MVAMGLGAGPDRAPNMGTCGQLMAKPMVVLSMPVRHGSGTTRPKNSRTMGQRWPLRNIIRSTSQLPAQPAAYPPTGRHSCTNDRADGLLDEPGAIRLG